ncbi:response regulator, partial [Shewanella sp. 0m-11]
ILLFEPSNLSRHAIERMLQRWGLKVSIAKNIKQLEFITTQSNHVFDFGLLSCRAVAATGQPAEVLKLAKSKIDYLLLVSDCAEQEAVFSQMRSYIDKQLSMPVGERLLSSSLLGQHSSLMNETLLPIGPALTPAKRENLSVLAVDDNPANLKLIDTLLKELVTQVQVADNGELAVKLAKERSYDLIFMDIQMPGTDGITATKQIRHSSSNRNTPIIAVTAHAIAEERERISSSGMDGYLPKPIDEAALKGVITRWKTKPKFTHFDQRTLNWDLCLTQANNKPDLALDMLKMLLKSLPETIEQIEGALSSSDNDKMLACIHKLHGACCYCGVPTTQNLCREIESGLKRGVTIDDVEPEILELLDELTKVESAANQVISQLSVDI